MVSSINEVIMTTAPPPAVLQDLWEHGAVGLHVVGPDAIVIDANAADYEPLGYARDEYVGHDIREFHVDADVIASILERLLAGKVVDKQEARLRRKDGGVAHVLITSSVCFEDGKPLNTRCFTVDITDRKLLEEELRAQAEQLRAQNERLRLQDEAIRQMSVPILRIWDGVLMVPVVGILDSGRAGQLTEVLLASLSYEGAEFAILDLTGITIVDTATMAHLLRTIQAAALIGTSVVVTGLRGSVAQTLVGLGVDLGGIETLGSLEAGIRYCIRRL
jgi:rsbT co-antagonist protein RsbR